MAALFTAFFFAEVAVFAAALTWPGAVVFFFFFAAVLAGVIVLLLITEIWRTPLHEVLELYHLHLELILLSFALETVLIFS